jgi:hypothetical protein
VLIGTINARKSNVAHHENKRRCSVFRSTTCCGGWLRRIAQPRIPVQYVPFELAPPAGRLRMLKIPHARQFSESGRLAQKSDEDFRAAAATTDPAQKAKKLDDARRAAEQRALAAAYTYLQRAVGVIAFLLPIVLVGGNWLFFDTDVKGSISAYYYTPMGGVFVGSLCALAVFFLSYNYRPLPNFKWDNVLSTVASLAALGVAFFPTANEAEEAAGGEEIIAVLHLVFAGVLFIQLAIFSLFLFRRSDDPTNPWKQRRNRVYMICGVIIAVAIVGVPVSNLFSWHLLLLLESIAVFVFSFSWLVKGGVFWFLNDPVVATAGPTRAPDAGVTALQPER